MLVAIYMYIVKINISCQRGKQVPLLETTQKTAREKKTNCIVIKSRLPNNLDGRNTLEIAPSQIAHLRWAMDGYGWQGRSG